MKLFITYYAETYNVLCQEDTTIQLVIRAYTYEDAAARLSYLGISRNLLHASQDGHLLEFLHSLQTQIPAIFDNKLWQEPEFTSLVLKGLQLCSFEIPQAVPSWHVEPLTHHDFNIIKDYFK